MPGAPDHETIKQIKDLHKRGRFLDAWELVKDLDPPEQWPEVDQRLRGARLLERLGAWGRARRMLLREWRRKETRHLAREDVIWEVLRARGALLTWQWLEAHPPDVREEVENHQDHHGFRGYLLTKLRDFERAEAALAEGLRAKPDSRWMLLLRADLFEAQHRRTEALALVDQVLFTDPDYISAIANKAELLADMQRDDEAVATLQAGLKLVQSSQIAAQLTDLLTELGRYDEAEAALDLYEKFTPLRSGRTADWLPSRRCDLASHRGDSAAALRWAEEIKEDGFYKRVAEKLKAAQGAELRRKVLALSFVRQHDATCAPATVTSIANYWGHDVLHLDLADEICYDGTPDYRERNWAEENGWVTREFRVTVAAAKELIDAGMPFVLNTVYPGGAHAQAVVGYDEFRTVLFIRDPGNRNTTEFLAEEALKEQAPFGPRGFVMVPAPEAARLAALSLPDAAVYDITHEISSALAAHERPRAAAALETLRRDWPNHLLRWHGELSLARYDGNHSQALRFLEELLSLHPDVVNWQMETMHMIREVRGREALLAALRETCKKKESNPLLWRMLARELQEDERNRAEVTRWLRRVQRNRLDAQAIVAQANLLWSKRDWPRAAELYRLASCLESRNESMAMSYFSASVWTRQTDAALSLLRRRYEDEGDLSGQPACTLSRALEQLNRTVESLAVLEESLKRRPGDADHAMYVAGEMAAFGKVEEARAILEQTPKNARAAAWHRVQARLAEKAGDNALQLEHRRAVVADQPLDSGGHRAIAVLLEWQEGRPAAIAHLRAACERFPFNWGLHMVLLEWLRGEGPAIWEAGVREMVRIDPDDAWARRELADALRAGGHFADAHTSLDLAAALEPGSASLHTVRASVYEDEEKPQEARASCRRALELDVDNTCALGMLIRLCRTQEERLAELKFVQDELKRQTTNGDAVLEFADIARRYLGNDELLAFLREGRAARPDLWHTGVTLLEQLRHMGLKEESTQIARSLTETFPLMPRVWLELSQSLSAQGERAAAIEAASKIRELNPGWVRGMEAIYELKKKAGDYNGAREVLEQALRHSPRRATLHGCLALILWHLGEKAAAVAHLQQAVEIDPGYTWGWEHLATWGTAIGQPEAAREAINKLLQERPAEARSWLILADSLTESSQFDQRIAALDKAIACAPKSWGPVDEKARVLAVAGRFEEALQLCRGPLSGEIRLRVRAAWILGYRGNYEEGVKAMEAVLADDPSQIWGWQLLSEWHQAHDKLNKAEDALEQLIRLQPEEETHLGRLAEVQLARRKKDEAKRTLERALVVAPDYRFALQKLFWIHIEERDFEMAAEVINNARPHLTNIEYLSRLFTLSCRQRRWPEAWTHLDAMLKDPEDDENAYVRIHNELKLLGPSWLKDAEKRIVDSLRGADVNTNAGWLYVQCCDCRKSLPDMRILGLVPVPSEAGVRAYACYIDLLARRWSANHARFENLKGLRERWRLRHLIQRHRAWLREKSDLYGGVGFALHSMGYLSKTIEWLSDWRERPAMEPYMMNNLVLCLQKKGRKEEATAVVKCGMALAEHNPVKMRFHLWAAMEHALNKDEAAARACMDGVNRENLDGYGKDLLDFVDILMGYQPSNPRPPIFGYDITYRLKNFMNSHKHNRLMMNAARRACALAEGSLRSLKPRFWYFTTRYEWALFVAVILIVLVVMRQLSK